MSGRSALFALLVVAITLLACAGASHELVGPGMYAIDCKRSASNCYEEAGDVCPSGFDIADAQNQQGAVSWTTFGENYANTLVIPTYKGQMLIRCHANRVIRPNASAAAPLPPPKYSSANTLQVNGKTCTYGPTGALLSCN